MGRKKKITPEQSAEELERADELDELDGDAEPTAIAGTITPAATDETETESPPAEETPAEQPPAETPTANPGNELDVSVVTPSAANTLSGHEVYKTKEGSLLAELATAESDCELAESGVNDLREQLKEAKADYDACVIRLRKLCRALRNDGERPLFATSNGEVTNGQPDSADASDKLLATPPPANDAWRKVTTSELAWDSVKGFGKKKREAIFDKCPTLGELEDVRASFGGLTNIQGIGRKLADEIENVILDWLSKNRDAAVLNFANGKPTAKEYDALTDTDRTAFLEGRVMEIGSDLTAKQKDDCWQSGLRSGESGHAIDDCPYIPGDEQDDWLRGYVSSQLEVDDTEEGEAEPGEEMSDEAAGELVGALAGDGLDDL